MTVFYSTSTASNGAVAYLKCERCGCWTPADGVASHLCRRETTRERFSRIAFSRWSDVRHWVWRLTRITLPHPGMRHWPK